MSENNNTNSEENLNEEEKVTLRIVINETDAVDILNQFRAPFPAIDDLDEIHLIVRHNKTKA